MLRTASSGCAPSLSTASKPTLILVFLHCHEDCRLFELREKTPITVAAASKYFANVMYGYRGYGLSVVSASVAEYA